VTLGSGQFLSAALMFWFFQYWEQRYRRDVETGREVLLAESVGLPEEARVLTAEGPETAAAWVSPAPIQTTLPERRIWALNRNAEAFARRAVAPTLLAVDAGLLVGDVTSAGAVLRPDYATGVGLATRLETIHDARFATRSGAVIRAGDPLERLAATSWIFLDDHPLLHHAVCDVAEVRTKWLDEARLLPVIAAAGMWLGDERGSALARACHDRGLIVRRAALREISDDGLAIGFGNRPLRLRGRPVVAGAVPPPLTVEVDGIAVACVRFARNDRPEAAEVVRRLRQGWSQRVPGV
jgi:cation transport ATPase